MSTRCSKVASNSSALLDRALPLEEEMTIRRHAVSCGECAENLPEVRQVRTALKSLPVRKAPPRLAIQVRVALSQQGERRRLPKAQLFWERLKVSAKLVSQNLMRPLAIPTAGGFASAMVLFSVLLPTLSFRYVSTSNDVPTGLYTDPAALISMVPVSSVATDFTVDLTIDSGGRIVDFSLPDGQHIGNSPELRRAMGNNLLFTQFRPATTFGQPMGGKIRVSFRSSHIDVRG